MISRSSALPTPDIVEKVVLGGVGQGSRVKTVVDLSTSGPGMATRVSKGLEPYGVGWIDAPVSGGVAGAKNGTLAVMASGPRATFEIAEPLLKNFGKVFFVGEKAGLAQVAKLGNNLLAAAALVISSEALVMGVKAGIDPKVMLDIINAGSGRNSATQDKFPDRFCRAPLISALRPGSPTRMCVCASTKRRVMGVPMVVGAAVRQMLAVTNAKFGPTSDFTSITRVVEEWAGVEVRG